MKAGIKIDTRTNYPTEAEARSAARLLGNCECEIIESTKENYDKEPRVWVFYLEHGVTLDSGMLRNWERGVFRGPGRNA